MRESLRGNREIVWFLLVFILCGVLRTLPHPLIQLVIAAAYCVLVTTWGYTLQQRIIKSSTRRLLVAISTSLLTLLILQEVRNSFFPQSPVIQRYAFYAYYAPVTVIPLLSLFAALDAVRPQNGRMAPAWQLFYLIPLAFTVLFCTNDLHQLAFRLPAGIQSSTLFTPGTYTHGPVYYAMVVWGFLGFLAMLVILLRSNQLFENYRRIFEPLLPVVLFIAYLALVFFDAVPSFDGHVPYYFPEAFCFLIMGMWEGCIRIGLVPSNIRYPVLFANSALAAQITDRDGKVIHTCLQAVELTPDQIRAALEKPVLLDENTRLHSLLISGGYVCWTEDITVVNRSNARLDELRQSLAGENVLIDMENKLRERYRHAREQERLYRVVSGSVTSQVDSMEQLLTGVDENTPDLKAIVTVGGVYQAYVKRRCNLALLAAGAPSMKLFDVQSSLQESLEMLRLNRVSCAMTVGETRDLPSEAALMIYDLFEAVIERAGTGLSTLLIRLESTEEAAIFRLTTEGGSAFDGDWQKEAVAAQRGTLTVLQEEGVQYVRLLLKKGGEAVC